MPTFSLRRAAWLALLTSAIALAACNQPDAPPDQAKAAPPAKGNEVGWKKWSPTDRVI